MLCESCHHKGRSFVNVGLVDIITCQSCPWQTCFLGNAILFYHCSLISNHDQAFSQSQQFDTRLERFCDFLRSFVNKIFHYS